VGWSGYVVSLVEQLGFHLPDALTNAPLTKGAGHFELVRTGALINLPAVLVVAAITALCYVGIHQSARFNAIVVAIKVTVIVLFIGFGMWVIDGANWQPFIPENTGTFGKFGWSGVVQAAGIIFFAYIGFDAVSTAAQEAKNPQRDMPIGILASLAVCTVLYVAVSAVLTGMVHYSELNTPAPVALALDRHPELSWLAGWIKLGAIAGMTSVMLVMMLGQPRIFYAMSRDGLLPPLFRRVHPTHKTPYVGTLITGTLAALIAGLFPVTILGELVSIGTLLAFTTVCIGVLVLRYTRPDIPRHFKVPAPWFVCITGALVCTGMMVSLPPDTWVRLAGWTVLGFLIYFFYGFRHSELRKAGR
jgi:APA family basic amino acid/polyamine antiporter